MAGRSPSNLRRSRATVARSRFRDLSSPYESAVSTADASGRAWSTAECDSHRADHHARPLASAVDTADSYGLDKSRNLDRATVARERRRLDGERTAMQNHATGKILVGDDTFGDVGMEGAIPSQQVRSLNAHRVQAQL